jgi:coproporphyrinogen III oxidase
MTNEEMQRAMNFIVEQQAQTAAKLDALAETQKRGEEKWSRTEEGIRALLAIAEIHEKEIQANTQHIMAQSQQIANLSESTKSTDERLKALINVVERQISNGRNGKQ